MADALPRKCGPEDLRAGMSRSARLAEIWAPSSESAATTPVMAGSQRRCGGSQAHGEPGRPATGRRRRLPARPTGGGGPAGYADLLQVLSPVRRRPSTLARVSSSDNRLRPFDRACEPMCGSRRVVGEVLGACGQLLDLLADGGEGSRSGWAAPPDSGPRHASTSPALVSARPAGRYPGTRPAAASRRCTVCSRGVGLLLRLRHEWCSPHLRRRRRSPMPSCAD